MIMAGKNPFYFARRIGAQIGRVSPGHVLPLDWMRARGPGRMDGRSGLSSRMTAGIDGRRVTLSRANQPHAGDVVGKRSVDAQGAGGVPVPDHPAEVVDPK